MRCSRRYLGTDYITSNEIHKKVAQQVRYYEDLLTIVKKRKLRWYGHVKRWEGLAKTTLKREVQWKRKTGQTEVGRQHSWLDKEKLLCNSGIRPQPDQVEPAGPLFIHYVAFLRPWKVTGPVTVTVCVFYGQVLMFAYCLANFVAV